jgi:cytochrome P450 family 135
MGDVVDGLPPGPRSPAWVQALRWAFRPTALIRECERRYGEIYTVRGLSGGMPYVFVSNPAAIKAIATGDRDALRAGAARPELFEPVFGPNSLLLLDGARHLRQRKLMLPPFHGERMQRYGELIESETERRIARWPRGAPFALQEEFQAITLEVILRAVFGFETGPALAQAREDLRRWLQLLASPAAMVPLLRENFGPARPWSPMARLRDRIHGSLDALIGERRADPRVADRDDVLSMLVGARDEDGAPLTNAELRDELITLLLAGHETTATALAWALELLLAHPEKLDALRADLPRGDAYLDAVVHETLRLRPPIPLFDRLVCEPVEVLGYRIPAGARGRVQHRRGPPARRPLSRAARVPPRALRRREARGVRVGAVRRRRAALPGRGVRALRDAHRPAHAARAHRAGRGRPAAGAVLPSRDRARAAQPRAGRAQSAVLTTSTSQGA